MESNKVPEPAKSDTREKIPPSFCEALRFWFKLGLISFGGPAAQISIMHHELVDCKKWISEKDFLAGLNYCMLLPGPEAQQLATYCGWRLHRTWGGLVAGILFILPSALLLWILSAIYVVYGEVPVVAAFFYGLKPAVVALVVHAILRMGGRVLKDRVSISLCVLSFIALLIFKISFPWILASAALCGFLSSRIRVNPQDEKVVSETHPLADVPIRWKNTVTVVLCGIILWWLPILALGMAFGWGGILFRQGVFYAKTALVTFGGAYAVLPHVASQVVDHFSWMTSGQMIAGMALAETTPGPLIMVLQYFGFVSAWNAFSSAHNPLFYATLGAFIATWATFVPSFIFILAGSPYIPKIQNIRSLSSALGGVTAAVVGVMANLGVWLAWEIFIPNAESVDWIAVAMGGAIFVLLKKTRIGIIWIVLLSCLCGYLARGIA